MDSIDCSKVGEELFNLKKKLRTIVFAGHDAGKGNMEELIE